MHLLSLLVLFIFVAMPPSVFGESKTLSSEERESLPYINEPEPYKDNRYKRIYIRKDLRYIETDDAQYELENQEERRYIKTDKGAFKEVEGTYDSTKKAQIVILNNRCPFLIIKVESSFILANKFLCTSLKKGDSLVGNFSSNGYADVRQGKYRCNLLIEEIEIESKDEAKKRLRSYCQ